MERRERAERIACDYRVPNEVFQELIFEAGFKANSEKMPQSAKGIDLFTLPLFLRVQPEDVVGFRVSNLDNSQLHLFMEVMDQAHRESGIKMFSKRPEVDDTEKIMLYYKGPEDERPTRRNVTYDRLQQLYGRYKYGPMQRFLISISLNAKPIEEDEPLDTGAQTPVKLEDAIKIQSYLDSLGNEKQDDRRKRMLEAADTIEKACNTVFAKELMELHRLTQLSRSEKYDQITKIKNNPDTSTRMKRALTLVASQTNKKIPERLLLGYVARHLKAKGLPHYGFEEKITRPKASGKNSVRKE